MGISFCKYFKPISIETISIENIKIEELRLSYTRQITKLDDFNSLKILQIAGCYIGNKAFSKVCHNNANTLEVLSINDCNNITELHINIFTKLKELYMACTDIADIFKCICGYAIANTLEILNINNCSKTTTPGRGSHTPKNLKELATGSCANTKKTPNICSKLTKSDTSYCEKITKLPKIKLKQLYMSECINIKKIPKIMANTLKILYIDNCLGLKNIDIIKDKRIIRNIIKIDILI